MSSTDGADHTMTRKCPHCAGKEFRRINRVGFFQRHVLPLFGLYPWECALCRRRTFLRGDGHSSKRRQHQGNN
jgi:hypothetical protein